MSRWKHRNRQRVTHACLQSAAAVPAFDRPREWEPTLTMDRQIAAARAEMGEEAWQRLNKEWEA